MNAPAKRPVMVVTVRGREWPLYGGYVTEEGRKRMVEVPHMPKRTHSGSGLIPRQPR